MSRRGSSSDILLRWATAVAKVLACGRIEQSQVQKLLELANSSPGDPFLVLEVFVLYQTGRSTWNNKAVARLVVEALDWLRQRGASAGELRLALGFVKWIYRAYKAARPRHVCPPPNQWSKISFAQLVNNIAPPQEFLSIASSL